MKIKRAIDPDNIRISPSQLNQFFDCEFAWLMKYGMNMKEPGNAHMARGNAYHKAMELIWEFDLTRDGPATDEQLDAAADEFALGLTETQLMSKFRSYGVGVFDRCWAQERKRVSHDLELYDSMYEHSMRAFLHFLNTTLLDIMRLVTEKNKSVAEALKAARPWKREQRVYTPDGKEMGIIDAVIKVNQDPNRIMVRDYKTSNLFMGADDEGYRRQMRFYAHVYKQKFGIMPEMAALNYVLHGTEIRYPVSEEDVLKVRDELEFMRSRLRERKFKKNTKFQWCKNCWFGKVGVCDRKSEEIEVEYPEADEK